MAGSKSNAWAFTNRFRAPSCESEPSVGVAWLAAAPRTKVEWLRSEMVSDEESGTAGSGGMPVGCDESPGSRGGNDVPLAGFGSGGRPAARPAASPETTPTNRVEDSPLLLPDSMVWP